MRSQPGSDRGATTTGYGGSVRETSSDASEGAKGRAGSILDDARSKGTAVAGQAQAAATDATRSVQDRVSAASEKLRGQVNDLKRPLETDEAATGVAGSTGASYDEFSTGGYTGDTTPERAVDAAADEAGTSPAPADVAEDVSDATSSQRSTGDDFDASAPEPDYPGTGNYGRGNLATGSQGSLGFGDATGQESSDFDADTGTATLDAASGGTWQGEAGGYAPSDTSPATTEGVTTEPADVADGGQGLLGGTGEDVVGDATEDVRAVGDLGAEELGSLEDLEAEAVPYGSETDAQYDANSTATGETSESLADVGYETTDYSSAAVTDAGMRIVDEDNPDLGFNQQAAGESEGLYADDSAAGSVTDLNAEAAVDAGSDYDTGDARPLGDYSQVSSGFASETDEATAGAGERADTAYGSVTGIDTSETGERSTEELGATGDLAASEFGAVTDTAEGGEGAVDYTGLFGDRTEVEGTDLSYLDESEASRFDFSGDTGASQQASAESGDLSGAGMGIADDIGPSGTGVLDAEGAVAADDSMMGAPESGFEDETGTAGMGVSYDAGSTVADASGGVVDDVGASPTGVQDAEGAVVATEDTGMDAAATGTAAAGVSAEGGRVRGDGGVCPPGYPIKGNASSKVYHMPGIPSYRGTKAEWCFATEDDAIAAGYRAPGQRGREASGASSAGAAGVTSDADTEHSAEQIDAPLSAETMPPGDQFGSGSDDIASLESSSPDDVAASALDTSDQGGSTAEEVTYAGAVRGDGTKTCPDGYPIKGNATSMIYHSPGRASYDATMPEWCFASESDAENAGFRAPRR